MRLDTSSTQIYLWKRSLRRPLAVLLVVLGCVFAEPLLCIVHCQLYIPWLLRHQHVHAHVHAAGGLAPLAASDSAGPWDARVAPMTTQPAVFCHHAVGGDPLSGTSVPSSPIHDVIPTLGVALLGVALLRRAHLRAPPPPFSVDYPPPTPPPLWARLFCHLGSMLRA